MYRTIRAGIGKGFAFGRLRAHVVDHSGGWLLRVTTVDFCWMFQVGRLKSTFFPSCRYEVNSAPETVPNRTESRFCHGTRDMRSARYGDATLGCCPQAIRETLCPSNNVASLFNSLPELVDCILVDKIICAVNKQS